MRRRTDGKLLGRIMGYHSALKAGAETRELRTYLGWSEADFGHWMKTNEMPEDGSVEDEKINLDRIKCALCDGTGFLSPSDTSRVASCGQVIPSTGNIEIDKAIDGMANIIIKAAKREQ